MQEITPRICALTRPWNNKTGEEAKVLEPTVSGVRTTTANAYDANIGMGTFALEDERDGKTYLVRRLADGNCWMVQNLDLDLEAVANGEITLDSTNTDLNSKTSWGPDPTTITSSFSGATTARTYDNGWDYIAYDSSTDTYSVATDSAYSTSHGSQYIGDYYNFYAATAETGIDESRIASESICPKGWTLPLGYKNNSAPAFAKLLENYGIATAMSSTTGVAKLHSIPLSFEFSGYYDNNTSFLNNINRALYLSSQEYTEDQSYFRALDFYRGSGNIYVPGVTTKSTGGAIRCVARD